MTINIGSLWFTKGNLPHTQILQLSSITVKKVQVTYYFCTHISILADVLKFLYSTNISCVVFNSHLYACVKYKIVLFLLSAKEIGIL